MPSQRACVAVSQARYRLSNGPLRVQSNGFDLSGQSILQREERVSFRGYDCILLSAWLSGRESKVAPRIVF